MSIPKRELVNLQEAMLLDRNHDVIGDSLSCCICADPFEVDQWCIYVSMGMVGSFKAIVPAHLGCAVGQGEVDIERVLVESSALSIIAGWDSSVAERNGNIGVIEFAQKVVQRDPSVRGGT